MSYSGGYQQYGGNPYSSEEANTGGYAQQNPYGGTGAPNANPYTGGGTGGGYASSNPYGGATAQPPNLAQENSNLSQPSEYSTEAYPAQQPSQPMSSQDFLARRDGTTSRINHLTASIQQIAAIHQRMLTSPDDNRSTSQLESLVSQTQVKNTQIKDEIKFLEKDAARDPANRLKRTHVESLKRVFKEQLEDFQREEADYSRRYRDAIARQYRIINPEATEEEVNEAANADWGNEGIFQQALKSNRSAQGTSVLGAVRARHNDIQRIEKTLVELALLFQQLNEQVVYQEVQVEQAEQQTMQVNDDAKHANEQLDKANKSARRARKLKWWTLGVIVAIICIIALVLGLYFGLQAKNNNSNNNSNNGA